MVLLSITPLLDGVLRLDIIAPFHTSGPPLLQFHLAIEQWGICSQNSFQSVYEWGFPISFQKETLAVSAQYYKNKSTATLGNGALLVDAISPSSVTLRLWDERDVFIIAIGQ